MKIETILTTGVYSKTSEEFFRGLTESGVDLLLDIRFRRGVRGAEYSFANSARLQRRLEELGIHYLHARFLAPTEAIRTLQKEVDKAEKVAKRQRTAVNPAFVEAYKSEILSQENLKQCLKEIEEMFASAPPKPLRICLLCVERDPQACHRSLLADRLALLTEADVKHI